MKTYGSQSMIAPLRTVLMKRPDENFAVADPVAWHYTARPNLASAQAEHDTFAQLVHAGGAEVIYHNEVQTGRADAIFVFDPVLITDFGAVILSMGKDLRRGEEASMARKMTALDIPILATLQGDARAEGGDMLWIDHDTLAVGIGFRTNAEAVRQLQAALTPIGVTVLAYDLPYYTGPEACLHLLSLISMVDEKLAVVYPPLMPVQFWQELVRRSFQFIIAPEEEFLTQSTNVLALSPRKCIMLAGNPHTRQLLEQAGCEVKTYTGNEISLKAEGGPTCLTRPLWRNY